VLHDMFAVPYDEIAPIVDRSPDATRQLASRARRRLQGKSTTPDPDLDRQREIVEAFLAASREGNFEALLAVLDADVVSRADLGGGVFREVRGAEAVGTNAQAFARRRLDVKLAVINAAVGMVSMTDDGRPFSVGGVIVRDGKIVELDFLLDPERLAQLDLTVLNR
jgi:ketosteroid isomerase-like protein